MPCFTGMRGAPEASRALAFTNSAAVKGMLKSSLTVMLEQQLKGHRYRPCEQTGESEHSGTPCLADDFGRTSKRENHNLRTRIQDLADLCEASLVGDIGGEAGLD